MRAASGVVLPLSRLLGYGVSLLGSKSYSAFFWLGKLPAQVSIAITLVAQHHHALNVLAAEVINDY